MVDKAFTCNIYDTDRLFNECVERNMQGEPNIAGSVISQATYSVSWNSYVKWIQTQLEMGRCVNSQPFGVIGFQLQEDKSRVVVVILSEQFLTQNGLSYNIEGDISTKSIESGPRTKLGLASIAKEASLPKLTVQTCLQNMFKIIGNILADAGNMEVDLGPLGKFRSINKTVSFTPCLKPKQHSLHGKQTVKVLYDLASDVGKIKQGETIKGEEGEKTLEFTKKQSLFGTNSNSVLLKSLQGTSPTKRFKKTSTKIDNQLLGAGADPLAIEMGFSTLTNNIPALINLIYNLIFLLYINIC